MFSSDIGSSSKLGFRGKLHGASWQNRSMDEGPLLRELRWVHGNVRRDLATVRELAGRVDEGEDADLIREGIAGLKTNGPLWQLRYGCLNYCRFVHSHHNLEDAALFPALRSRDEALGPVIERLEAEHRVVSDLLDEVEAAAGGPLGEEAEARERLSGALSRLADDLLAHLDYEEEALGPTLNGLEAWPV
jgi:hypothetical protein